MMMIVISLQGFGYSHTALANTHLTFFAPLLHRFTHSPPPPNLVRKTQFSDPMGQRARKNKLFPAGSTWCERWND